jgi:hypothetical protein
MDFVYGLEGQGLEMLPVSSLPNLIGGEKGLHAPTSNDFTDTMSNLNDITKALSGFQLLDRTHQSLMKASPPSPVVWKASLGPTGSRSNSC